SATAEARARASGYGRERLEVARRHEVGVERADEELDFLGHVRVGHPAQVAEQGGRAAVQLVVEAFDGGLVEDALPPGLALRATEHDAPVAGTLLGPVQRVHELPGAVEADVQLVGAAGGAGGAVLAVENVRRL